jgi:protein translocase SecG subunit
MNITTILQTLTIILGLSTIALILLNQPQTDNTFGGSNSFQVTRRGAEKQLHNLTIISSVLLVLVILISKVF